MTLSEQEIQEVAQTVARVFLNEDIDFMTTVEVLDDEEIEVTEDERLRIHEKANEIIADLYMQIF